MQAQGITDIDTLEVTKALGKWAEAGRTKKAWSEYTTRRVAQGLLSTLRNFGVLQGSVDGTPISPNAGQLFSATPLGVNTSDAVGFDFSGVTGTGYLSLTPPTGSASSLYTIDITGRNQLKEPTPSFASDPAWSPLLS